MYKQHLIGIEIAPEVDPSLRCLVVLFEKDKPVLMTAVSIGADYLLTGAIRHF